MEHVSYFLTKFYKSGNNVRYEVEDKDYSMILFEHDLVAIKYEEVLRDGKREYTKEEPMCYFGKRTTMAKLYGLPSNYGDHMPEGPLETSMFKKDLQRIKDDEMIVCYAGGFLYPLDNSVTIEEVENKEHGMLVECKPIFSGVAKLLCAFEQDDFTFKKGEKQYIFSTRTTINKTSIAYYDHGCIYEDVFSIFLRDLPVVEHKVAYDYFCAAQGRSILKVNKAKQLASFAEITEVFKPLIRSYSYLEIIWEQIEEIVKRNNGKISEGEILSLGRDYVNKNCPLEEKCMVLDRIVSVLTDNK